MGYRISQPIDRGKNPTHMVPIAIANLRANITAALMMARDIIMARISLSPLNFFPLAAWERRYVRLFCSVCDF